MIIPFCRHRKARATLTVLAIAGAAATAALAAGCSECSCTVLAHSRSPTQAYTVRVRECDCGQTVADFDEVVLKNESNPFYRALGTETVVARLDNVADIRWLKENVLLISYNAHRRTYLMERQAGNVTIQYRAVARP